MLNLCNNDFRLRFPIYGSLLNYRVLCAKKYKEQCDSASLDLDVVIGVRLNKYKKKLIFNFFNRLDFEYLKKSLDFCNL